MERKPGCFELDDACEIVAQDDLHEKALQLKAIVSPATGIDLKLVAASSCAPGIALELDTALAHLGPEGYQLDVSADGIRICAQERAGIFYGIQTLRQLLPSDIASSERVTGTKWTVPCVAIVDSPRFSWRGFMLDEGRYFKGMPVVKSLMDEMSHLKMNMFHWHLTDDQGWRIEIKKYPLLTEVGSKRSDSQIGGWKSVKRAGEPHEGFYTQEEIKEIVRYAADRHITVVPEISMPMHSGAAVQCYPEWGTTGENFMGVPTYFGTTYHGFNPASEKVFAVISDILDEVASLFPSKIIHTGGDEAHFDCWYECPEVQEVMKREGLKTMPEVQYYFTRRVAEILENKGRVMMGWGEITGDHLDVPLEGQPLDTDKELLPKGTVVHFWKGDPTLAIRAAEQGYHIVNAFNGETYLDYIGMPLSKAYGFDPILRGLDEQYRDRILGSSCQMWSEWTPTVESMERLVYPRLAAYADVGWTPLEQKDEFGIFVERVHAQLERWNRQGIPYGDIVND